jgi:hypothetical protein
METLSPAQLAVLSEHVAKYLTPNQDLPCVYVMFGFMTRIFPFITSEQNAKRASPELNSIRTASMRWLTHPYSPQAMLRRSQRPCACTLSARQTSTHHTGHTFCAQMGTDFPGVCATLLSAILKFLIQPEFEDSLYHSLPRLDKLRHRRMWPMSVEELLPYGPRDTVRGLLAWLGFDLQLGGTKVVDNALVLHVAQVLTHYGYPIALPYLITSNKLISQGVLYTIQVACSIFYEFNPDKRRPGPTEDGAIGSLGRCSGLLMTLNDVCTDAERQLLTREDQNMLMVSYVRVIEYLGALHARFGSDTVYLHLQEYTSLAAVLLHDFPNLQNTPDMSPLIISASSSYTNNIRWRMWQVVIQVNRRQRCARPNCSHTYADTMAFKRCGGCRRVVYCSRQCQKAAWRHVAAPHRHVCGSLRKMCLRYAFKPSGRSPPTEELAGFDRASASLIMDHFFKHDTYELKTSCR